MRARVSVGTGGSRRRLSVCVVISAAHAMTLIFFLLIEIVNRCLVFMAMLQTYWAFLCVSVTQGLRVVVHGNRADISSLAHPSLVGAHD